MRLPAAGLVEACDDGQLFAFPLWPRQREILRAIEETARLHVLALGRRSGKTTMSALLMLWDALLRPELGERLRRGKRRYAVGVATNLRQARLLLRAARSIIEASPLLSELVESATDDELLFHGDSAIAAFPCTSRGARGYPISALIMDEAAFFLDTDGNSAAEPMWQALAPATSQFGDAARIVLSSTPYGVSGFFAEMFQRASSGELEAEATAHHATSVEMNPTLDRAFLEREEKRDSESFRSEYLAEFLAGGAAFLRRRGDPRLPHRSGRASACLQAGHRVDRRPRPGLRDRPLRPRDRRPRHERP